MALSFRFASAADVPELVGLVESAYRGDASRKGWTTEADLLEGQRVDAQMLTELLERADAEVLVASEGGAVVACCELQRPSGAAPRARAAYLGMFAVHPERQGGGLGREVLAEAERVAREEWGAEQLSMTVISLREELIDWYGRRGYARTGEVADFPYGDERFGIPTRDDLRFEVLAKRL